MLWLISITALALTVLMLACIWVFSDVRDDYNENEWDDE